MLNYSLASLGDLLATQKKYPESIARYRETLALIETKLKAEPKNVTLIAGLAYALGRMGDILIHSGDAPGALTYLRRAVELNENLVADDPTNANVAWNLVTVRTTLADALAAVGSIAEARDQYARARESAVALTQKNMQGVPQKDAVEKLDAKLAALTGTTTMPATTAPQTR